jgi:hypothetical protein
MDDGNIHLQSCKDLQLPRKPEQLIVYLCICRFVELRLSALQVPFAGVNPETVETNTSFPGFGTLSLVLLKYETGF